MGTGTLITNTWEVKWYNHWELSLAVYFFKNIYLYLFIWLCGALVAPCGSFTAVHVSLAVAAVLGLTSCGRSAGAQ